MPILTWKDDYSVGVSQIDDEHMKLIRMINKAYDSVTNMKEQEVLLELVEDMKAYAAVHFATEEELMNKHNYPDLKEHKIAHDDFIIKAAMTDKLLSSDRESDPIEVFKFLADWLKNHIMATDKKLAAFLIEQGVR